MITRRSFLTHAATAAAVAASGRALISNAAQAQPAGSAETPPDAFRLGIAGYSFNKFKLDPALQMMKQVDVHYLCIKDFHLPLDSDGDAIAAFHAKCRSFNVTGYGVGPIYMGSEDEVTKAFAYAQRVGVKLLVGVPFRQSGSRRVTSPELLPLINRLVQQYDIKYAIHNHGPDMPELFPSAESAMELVKDLDPRVGLCLDIGHQLRDGKDPLKSLLAFADRVHDIHLKNVTSANRQGRAIELPRGAINLMTFVRELRQMKYSGVCSLEHEKDMDNPSVGIAESIGYFRGVVDATR
jgi:inosose dehydratase